MPTDDGTDLLQRAKASVAITHSKLAPGRKTVIPSMLTFIAQERIRNPQHRRQWIALIGVESGYDGHARSAKGAVGLGQLLPKYRNDFGAACGITDVTPEDLNDDFLNATLSACYYQQLIDENAGDADLAAVAYVAGSFSEDLAKARAGKQPGREARDYVRAIHAKQAKAVP